MSPTLCSRSRPAARGVVLVTPGMDDTDQSRRESPTNSHDGKQVEEAIGHQSPSIHNSPIHSPARVQSPIPDEAQRFFDLWGATLAQHLGEAIAAGFVRGLS